MIVNEKFDPIKKAKRHNEAFSLDLQNVFDMGQVLQVNRFQI